MRHEARGTLWPLAQRTDTMAKYKDSRKTGSDAPVASQSNRLPFHLADSDPHVTIDQAQQPQLQQQQSRAKSQKHLVGGGTGGRMHARVPSSKTLHKYHASTSSAKLARRQNSPSPERGTAGPASSHHRRTTSDLKLSRDFLSTNLKKNASNSSLARNRSHIDIGKKSKSSTHLKRTSSIHVVDRLKLAATGSKVHFNLGDEGDSHDDDGDDGDDDEWVDASTFVSPLLSRRASTIGGGGDVSATTSATPHNCQRRSPGARDCPSPQLSPQSPPTKSGPAPRKAQRRDRETANYLTSRILQRASSYGAPPKMSRENVQVGPQFWRQQSPNGDALSIFSSTPQTYHGRPGSSGGREFLTSRFIGSSGLDSTSTSESAVLQTLFMDPGQTPSTPNSASEIELRRPYSAGNLTEFTDFVSDEGLGRGIVGGTSLSRQIVGGVRVQGIASAPKCTNRTQQKINLERAISGLDGSRPPGITELTVSTNARRSLALVGSGSGYDSPDSKISKLWEKTGKEYLVIRRHQNPIARSLLRIVPVAETSATHGISRPSTSHAKKNSDDSVSFGPGQNSPCRHRLLSSGSHFDFDGAMLAIAGKSKSSGHTRASREISEGGGAGTFFIGPDGGSGDDLSRMHEQQRLSGVSSTGDAAEDDAETLALLRTLWEKNVDLSASQD